LVVFLELNRDELKAIGSSLFSSKKIVPYRNYVRSGRRTLVQLCLTAFAEPVLQIECPFQRPPFLRRRHRYLTVFSVKPSQPLARQPSKGRQGDVPIGLATLFCGRVEVAGNQVGISGTKPR